MAFHVFGHVEAVQRHAHRKCQLARNFGLTHAGGAREQEAADGFMRVAKTAARHLDGGGKCIDCLVLTEYHCFQIAIERLECVAVIVRHGARRNARNLGDNLLDLVLADHLFLPGLGQDALRSPSLIQHVDCLVRQMTVVDEASG